MPVLLIIFALISLGVWWGHPTAPHTPAHLYVSIDCSGSARSQLGACAHRLAGLVACLEEEDRLTVYRLDYRCKELYDGPPPDSLEAFKLALIRDLGPDAERPGTRPALYYQAVAERLSSDHGPVVLVSFTDGGDDDPELTRRSQSTIAGLADQVQGLYLLGVDPDARALLRAALEPFGDRLYLQGRDQCDTAPILEQLAQHS